MARRSVKQMAFREVFGNPPATVSHTRRKKGAVAARKQQVARKRGVRVPKR